MRRLVLAPSVMRTLLLGALLLGGAPLRIAGAGAGPPLDKKGIETLAVAWAKARPRTRFDAWDPKVRADLLAQAKALGAIPEGTMEEVRDVFWKALRAVRKKDPVLTGKMATPYGEATWIQNGRGGPKAGLVIGLHGGGEGAGSASEAAGKWMLPGCLAIYPQGVKLVHDTWNTVHGERFVQSLLESAKLEQEIDPDRVFTMGFSMGGTGSWFWAGRHPDMLAASAPCAGVLMAAPKSQVPTKAEVTELQHGFVMNVRNLAMYWFIGLADKNCMPGTYLYAWDVLEGLRKQDPTGYGKLEFATYPGLPHAFPPGEPSKLLSWIAPQRRDPWPRKIVWEQNENLFPQPEDDTDRKVGRLPSLDLYWLHCERPVDRAIATATLSDNAIDLTLVGGDTQDYTVWLSPKVVDVAKDIIVRVEGKEVFRGRPVPDVLTVLETLDAHLDRVLTFDRRVRLARE